jgi:transcriptional regulator with GAF, ATPase, and Fis domain
VLSNRSRARAFTSEDIAAHPEQIRELIRRCIVASHGFIADAARMLGTSYPYLLRLMQRVGMEHDVTQTRENVKRRFRLLPVRKGEPPAA